MTVVLILGVSGMLGHALCRRLVRSELSVWAAVRTTWDASPGLGRIIGKDRTIEAFDVLDERCAVDAIKRVRPDVVVNCVGLIKQKPEAVDAEQSISINALAPHRLARVCDTMGAKLIQPGTDCVFSGKSGFYAEDDPPDPVDLYGRSKLLGEVTRAPHLTLRTSIIGWQLTGAQGLAEWFRGQRHMSAQGTRRHMLLFSDIRLIYSGVKKRE